ncbi:MAG: DUF2914 domain-containing protein [Endomicrobium sp.]|jgi:hypothetical protein|nr:DUF2914 domain-containing protein [Endomicrobium sp.]
MKKVSLALALAIAVSAGSYVFAQEKKEGVQEKPAAAAQESASKDSAPKSSLTVSDSALATAIADRQPEGKATEFSKDIEKIYYWTKIEGAKEPTTVKHVWYSGTTAIGEVSLNVTTPSFRTWSSKTLYPGLSEMSVEVVDADGNVLKKETFTIK